MKRRNSPGHYIHLVMAFFLMPPLMAWGQFYYGLQQSFDRGRTTFTDFFWTYYQYDDFNTYFYLNGQELAGFVSQAALKIIPEMSRRLDAPQQHKMHFFVFNRLSDLRQSNIGLASETAASVNTGGVTDMASNKVFLYFEGDYSHFEMQLRSGIARVLLNQSIYGGSLAYQVTSSATVQLPEWFTEGVVAYLAEPWSTEKDDRLREAFLTGRFRNFSRLTGSEAILAGQSLWKLIAEKYGVSILPNIIYLTRLGRSIDQGLTYTIGISLKRLLNEWEGYYLALYKAERFDQLRANGTLKVSQRKEQVYYQLKVSHDGAKAAYVQNFMGRYLVIIHDVATDQKNTVFRGGHRFNEEIDQSYPVLAWHPGSKILAFITEEKGLLKLFLYNTADKTRISQYLYGFEKILDIDYAPDGFRFVMSAQQQGQTNIYVYHIPSGSYEQITSGPYDDIHPRFTDNGKRIVFSSNRPPGALEANTPKITGLPQHSAFNIFQVSYPAKSQSLQRITNNRLSDQIMPVGIGNGFITYLSDMNGIQNRYIARLDSTIAYVDTITHYRYFSTTRQITNYPRPVVGHDVSVGGGLEAEIARQGKNFLICVNPLVEPDKKAEAPLEYTSYMINKSEQAGLVLQGGVNELPKAARSEKKFRSVRQNEYAVAASLYPTEIPENDTGVIQADLRRMAQVDLTKLRSEPTQVTFAQPKRRNYNVEYSINQFKSQLDFSFISATYQPFTGGDSPLYLNPGLNAFVGVTLTDLLDDYEISGGVRINTNLTNNEYVFSFANNKKRLDKQLVFHRQLIMNTTDNIYVKYRLHELYGVLTWPFSRALSIKNSIIYKQTNEIPLSVDQFSLQTNEILRLWAGLKAELIFNNSREVGTNLPVGTRWKLFAEYYQSINEKESGKLTLGLNLRDNMVVLGADIRHYIPVYRNIIWASRAAASTSVGNNLLVYYMGGVDSWITPTFNRDIAVDPSKNYVYQTLATNLRGFSQNIRNGNSFVVFNSELRIPVFSLLLNRPIKSQMIRDFQLVGFADAGTAWTGLHPFSEENHLFRKYFSQGPISGWVELQKEPFVAGFGGGLRTSIMGYFIRGDYAWGFDDKKIQKPIFYLSFGLDF